MSNLLSLVAFVLAAASPPDEVGQPVALIVHPDNAVLVGPRSLQQLIVTGRYADGSERDLTSFASYRSENGKVAALDPGGLLRPRGDGSTGLTIQVGGKSVQAAAIVRDFGKHEPVSFRRDMMAALGISGCNGGSCHGIPSGRNGFRLSLWGHDPAFDYLSLTRDTLARRTNRHKPEDGLILQKALGRLPHEGGRRFGENSLAADIFRTWQTEGLRDDPSNLPALTALDVTPPARVLRAPARFQQLAARARFADGSSRDVTRLTVFSSSDPAIGKVDATGLVELRQGGEVAILCRYDHLVSSVRLSQLNVAPGFAWPNPPENNYVDHHVFAKLREQGLVPSELCGDAEFIRRVHLDVCGILPPPADTRAFLASTDPQKRVKLIDSLLARPEFDDLWTLKWADLLRLNRKFIQPQGAKAYHAWLRDAVRNDTPFDQVVRALLTGKGHSYKDAAANYYAVVKVPKTPDEALHYDICETTAQLFLGIRLKCAKCHNHPFESWTQNDYYGLAAFFTQVAQYREGKDPNGNPEHRPVTVNLDPKAKELIHPISGKPVKPQVLRGLPLEVPSGKDRRELLADWLVRADNPFFARSVVNRLWFHLNGRGIVDPVDDFRDSNPSVNDALLEALTRDYVVQGFRSKPILRTILQSRTYQLSTRANSINKDDGKYFSHVVARPLTAEQLLDAICKVTGVPEPFDGMPAGTRAMQLFDGQVISSTGRYLNYDRHPFMKQFGQPDRELACECGRESNFTLSQAMEMLNGPTLASKLRQADNRLGRLLTAPGINGSQPPTNAEVLDELYLLALARSPSQRTTQNFLEYVAKAPDRRKAWEDVLWVILRSKEFIYRH